MVPLKSNVTLTRIFSQVNWSTQGEQRVEEMASQANTRLEPLAKSSFLQTVVPSRCCEVIIRKLDTLLAIQVTYTLPRVLERFHRGKALITGIATSVGL